MLSAIAQPVHRVDSFEPIQPLTNHGPLAGPRLSLGTFIGTGIVSLKMSTARCPESGSELLEAAVTGTRTPHSQLRILSLGSPVARSLTRRPLRNVRSEKLSTRGPSSFYLPGRFREVGTSDVSPSLALGAIREASWPRRSDEHNLERD